MTAEFLLVVNGDDGGLHADSDAALLQAGAQGCLTSVSVVAGGRTAESFVARAVEAGLGVGLHLNLTQGVPLASDVSSLTTADGRFHDKQAVLQGGAWRAFEPGQLEREVRAQWERLCALGCTPDHLDGHNHVHLLPPVLEALQGALRPEAGLFLRVPDEPECPAALRPPWPEESYGRRELEDLECAWRLADRFTGLLFSARAVPAALEHLRHAQPGVTEIMVHPGCRPGSGFTRSGLRDQEARLLCTRELASALQSWGYRRCRFGDVP